MTTTRRRFIEILPFPAIALGVAACSDNQTASPTTNPTANPDPAPAPAPMAPEPMASAPSTGTPNAAAPPAAVVGEQEAQALAVGYVTDAARADKAKYPRHEAGQQCAGCALFTAAPTAAVGPCGLFGGREVAGPGWCSAWAKRAA